ncbi:MAG: glutamate--tRNA ligase, partial [Candidatus Pacebacteria bacterium]|nr:glutamate--tRNA ligase [Candidatus Paceibacterota bacterium]
KKHGGTFILRIEDTDKSREVEGSIEHIIESLKWLGIDWDIGPDKPSDFDSCLQSERLDIYKKYAMQLVAKGLAYPDPYTTVELQEFRAKAEAEKRPFLFRDHRPIEPGEWDGTQPLRFLASNIKRSKWNDVVRGDLSAGEEMIDDIIIIKADGYPTYNFAHIIDDLEMEVTHVMRGEEFISSTPKFLSIYEALEIEPPIFATLPPIMGPDGKKKLSKRDGAKDLLEYRTDGYLPEAMRNFLALIGWNPGGEKELYPSNDKDNSLISSFSLEKIQKSGGAFDEEKLRWMNKQYLNQAPDTFKVEYFNDGLPDSIKELEQYSDERLQKLTSVAFERIRNKVEIREAAGEGEYDWAFDAPKYDIELIKWKKDPSVKEAGVRLQKAVDLLATADFSSPDTVKAALWDYAEEEGRGEVLWPIRTALSGRDKSPDPFTIAYIIGQEETISRLKTACDKIER